MSTKTIQSQAKRMLENKTDVSNNERSETTAFGNSDIVILNSRRK